MEASVVVLILPPDQAAPGMVLAAPVPQPNAPGADLLKRGYVLDRAMLDRLRGLGVQALYVDFPDLSDLDRHLAVTCSPARKAAFETVRRTFEHLLRDSRLELDFSDHYDNIRDLLSTLNGQGQHPLYFDLMGRLGPETVGHSAAVAHLALTLGLKLERYLIAERPKLPISHARDTVNLGVAAMLHDVGKARLSPTLQVFHALHPPEDPVALAEWRDHTRLGYELIRAGVDATAASAVLHHHQSFDGAGFPVLKLREREVTWAGKRIHIFARILAAADTFDRLATCTDPARRLTNLETLALLRKHHAHRLDGTVLRTLHAVCPPFPPGSRVTLSDGHSAVVTRVDDSDLFRPTVRRLSSSANPALPLPTLTGEDLDLRVTPDLHISETGGISAQGLTATPSDLDALIIEPPPEPIPLPVATPKRSAA